MTMTSVDGPVDKHSQQNETLTDTTKENRRSIQERKDRFDKEVQEIEEIHLPHSQSNAADL
jgi:predicted  nucleic acid-binding Zn-ribbon protein